MNCWKPKSRDKAISSQARDTSLEGSQTTWEIQFSWLQARASGTVKSDDIVGALRNKGFSRSKTVRCWALSPASRLYNRDGCRACGCSRLRWSPYNVSCLKNWVNCWKTGSEKKVNQQPSQMTIWKVQRLDDERKLGNSSTSAQPLHKGWRYSPITRVLNLVGEDKEPHH